MTSGEQGPAADVALAVVGVIVPDEPRYHGPAFNRAAQMFQNELVRGIQRAGMDVTAVFGIEPLPAFPRSARLAGAGGEVTTRSGLKVRLLRYINVTPLKALTVGAATLLALTAWAWRMRQRPRIIHVFNLTMPPGVFVWLAGRLTRSRVTVSALDVWKPGGLVPDLWRWRADFQMQRLLLPRFDGHMVVTTAIRDELIPGRSVTVIEGGIAPERFETPASSQPASVPRAPDRFRIVLSGTLASYNGVELALSAMALLPADCELVVAGTGALDDYVARWAHADPRIQVLGFLSFEDVLSVYRNADLLLNVRITKAIDTRYFFPSKLMELLASGTPVLSTCTGQVEAEYGSVAYLLHDETPEGLAARILEIRAIDPDLRRRLGMRAREFMFREKTWERQGQRLVAYLRTEVLGERPV